MQTAGDMTQVTMGRVLVYMKTLTKLRIDASIEGGRLIAKEEGIITSETSVFSNNP
jgi:hypothetical protein